MNQQDILELTQQGLSDEELARRAGVNVDEQISIANERVRETYREAVDRIHTPNDATLSKYDNIAQSAGYNGRVTNTEEFRDFLNWEFENRGRIRGGDEGFWMIRQEVADVNPDLMQNLQRGADTVDGFPVRVGAMKVGEADTYRSAIARADQATHISKELGNVPVQIDTQGNVHADISRQNVLMDLEGIEIEYDTANVRITPRWSDDVRVLWYYGIMGDNITVEILGNGAKGKTNGTETGFAPDGVNQVLFGNWNEPGVIAVTVTWVTVAEPKEIVEWDQLYDQVEFDWSITGEARKIDLLNIVTHELGHSFGLKDMYYDYLNATCTSETMFGLADNGEINKKTLAKGDIKGLDLLY